MKYEVKATVAVAWTSSKSPASLVRLASSRSRNPPYCLATVAVAYLLLVRRDHTFRGQQDEGQSRERKYYEFSAHPSEYS